MFAHLYESSDSSDEERHGNAPRVYLDRLTLNKYSDDQVISHYRLPRFAIQELADRISIWVKESSYPNRATDLDLLHKLQIALFYYATGDHQKTIARACGVSQKIVSFAITEVTDALLGIADEFVKFPSPNELEDINHGFYMVCL